MPNVGGRKFPYDAAGKKKAAEYAAQTGMPMHAEHMKEMGMKPKAVPKPGGPPTFTMPKRVMPPSRKKK